MSSEDCNYVGFTPDGKPYCRAKMIQLVPPSQGRFKTKAIQPDLLNKDGIHCNGNSPDTRRACGQGVSKKALS